MPISKLKPNLLPQTNALPRIVIWCDALCWRNQRLCCEYGVSVDFTSLIWRTHHTHPSVQAKSLTYNVKRLNRVSKLKCITTSELS